ncbi:MAG: RNA methyltransferase [Acidimicrobiales bacterium]|jgi:TrmH family RNA methyltransferase
MNRLGARDKRVQRLRRLLRRSSVRGTERAFVAEGVRIVEAALDASAPVESLFVAAGWRSSASVTEVVERADRAGLAVFELGPGIMERVADTVSPQPVCAVVEVVDLRLDELLSRSGPGSERAVVLVCVDVRDPGNLGAVLRIAGATGVSGVICCEGTVDPFNPKVVRASAGAVFRVPLVTDVAPAGALAGLAAHGYRCWATVPRGGTNYEAADLDGRTALVLGNEGAGLPGEIVGALDGSMTIPMADGTESLNVAMTAAVLCFDLARRRRTVV